MDKVLYFRSSPDPLILDEEQRETRKKGISKKQVIILFVIILLARIESLKKSSGIMVVRGRTLPELTSSSHRTGYGGHRSDLSNSLMDSFCFLINSLYMKFS
jgi:hypothetical protein